jgi:hypothetical protein
MSNRPAITEPAGLTDGNSHFFEFFQFPSSSTRHPMRHKRAKQYKKAMALYHHNFNFREPYQVLGTHALVSFNNNRRSRRDVSAHGRTGAHVSIAHGVSHRRWPMQTRYEMVYKTFSYVAVMTPCTLHELKSVGKAVASTLNTAQASLDKRMCHHAPYVSARECLESMIGALVNVLMLINVVKVLIIRITIALPLRMLSCAPTSAIFPACPCCT